MPKKPPSKPRARKSASTAKSAPAAPVAAPAPPPDQARRLLARCCRALDGKKAAGLRILDVAGLSSITNFIVVATATSNPHLKALRGALEDELKAAGAALAGVDYRADSGWLVVDAFEIMFHLFLPAQRDNYRIEALWKDAPALDAQAVLATA